MNKAKLTVVSAPDVSEITHFNGTFEGENLTAQISKACEHLNIQDTDRKQAGNVLVIGDPEKSNRHIRVEYVKDETKPTTVKAKQPAKAKKKSSKKK